MVVFLTFNIIDMDKFLSLKKANSKKSQDLNKRLNWSESLYEDNYYAFCQYDINY